MYAAKAVAAFVASIATIFLTVVFDNQVDQGEISQSVALGIDALLVLLSALGVYAVPNGKRGVTRVNS
jgi:hypothetical protein